MTNHIAFCFGRFQPPHSGHKVLMETTSQFENYKIFLSPTQDCTDNPLSFNEKITLINTLFPMFRGNISTDATLSNIMKIAVSLYDAEYTDITFVAGIDQVESFRSLLNKYNNVASSHGYYNFNSITVETSNSPDIRSTQIRNAAIIGEFDLFVSLTGYPYMIAIQIYDAIRKGRNEKELKRRSRSPKHT